MSVQTPLAPLTYSLAEASTLLGINRRTLSKAISRGQVPAIRIGGRLLISRAVVAAMVAHKTLVTVNGQIFEEVAVDGRPGYTQLRPLAAEVSV